MPGRRPGSGRRVVWRAAYASEDELPGGCVTSSEQLERKLAAILYADVAGYSRLTGEDEEGTHRRLSEYFDLISAAIQQYHGRVVHYAGDAVLADFGTVSECLQELDIGKVDFKARGVNIDLGQVHQKVRGRGKKSGLVVFTRSAGRPVALVCGYTGKGE